LLCPAYETISEFDQSVPGGSGEIQLDQKSFLTPSSLAFLSTCQDLQSIQASSYTLIAASLLSQHFFFNTMGKLIKNHWARLIALSAAAIQLVAALEGFFWPKIFWDFLTKNLDGAVKPIPALQIINLVSAIFVICWEWPLKPLASALPAVHRSIEARLVVYPLLSLAAILMYQSTNAAIYYLISVGVYFWAFCQGEVSLHSDSFTCNH
jgi:hypothetical protein